MKKIVALVAILCGGMLYSCSSGGGGGGNDDPVAEALAQTVDLRMLPAVEGFAQQAERFRADAAAFCTEPSSGSLQALQNRWKALLGRWYRLLPYNIGPLDDDIVFPAYIFIDSLRLRGTDYTETVRGEITSTLASDDILDQPYFRALTFQNVGLLALEALTFETASDEHSTDLADVVGEYEDQARKCEILSGITNELVEQAEYVVNGWTVEHLDTGVPFRTIYLENELEDGTDSVAVLLVSAQELLDYLHQRRVVNLAAQIADQAWQAIGETIDEIEILLEGTEETPVNFFDVMEAEGFDQEVAIVRANILRTRDAIEQQNPDELTSGLRSLDGNFKREIPDGLKVELGINFSDGD